MDIKKILVPTDFSDDSEPAVRYALDLAERLSAKVVLLNAFTLPVYPVLDGVLIAEPSHAVELVTRAGAELEVLRARVARPGLAISTRAVQGPAAEAILTFARDEQCDLIVMGTHGRTGWRHLVLGSVAERVVRAATLPVLTIGAKAQPSTSFFDAPPLL